jgi:hypothetical protein
LFRVFDSGAIHLTLNLFHIYKPFYACATSVDQDQQAHPCGLIRVCTGRILVSNNLTNQKANSLDPKLFAIAIKVYPILFAIAIKVYPKLFAIAIKVYPKLFAIAIKVYPKLFAIAIKVYPKLFASAIKVYLCRKGLNPLLHIWALYHRCDQCRSRSAGTSVLSD